MDSIFIKIIKREIPAEIIYEDDYVLAFLDAHPIRKGHSLVIPKHPYTDIFALDADAFAHMARVAHTIAQALKVAVAAKGINIHMNNGYEAGQDVFHAHMHIIPRYDRNEAFHNTMHETYAQGEATRVAETIRETVLRSVPEPQQ